MEITQELYKSKDLLKKLDIDNQLELQLKNVKNEFSNIVKNVIDGGANYIIKAMPINDNLKDILLDVKKAFKTKDFGHIVSTAINSSIREGLEMLSVPKEIIKDIGKLKDVAMKGGLSCALSAGVEIILNKYVKNNLNFIDIKDFISKMKDFINNRAFTNKLDQGISKSIKRLNKFQDLCNNWYKSYNEFNLNEINSISKKLTNLVNRVSFNEDAKKTNDVIQNLTTFINNKKEKLSEMQFKACSII